MNIMAGMIVPDRNCAPKLARYTSPFSVWKSDSTSFWWPNVLTME